MAEEKEFQSTPPTRRATNNCACLRDRVTVSIHAPHTEGDVRTSVSSPTQPVSIHAPHTEGDPPPVWCWRSRWRFNPRPPHGGRP